MNNVTEKRQALERVIRIAEDLLEKEKEIYGRSDKYRALKQDLHWTHELLRDVGYTVEEMEDALPGYAEGGLIVDPRTGKVISSKRETE